MRLLVRKNVFSVHHDGGETLYSLTPLSRWLLWGAGLLSLAPMMLLIGHLTLVSVLHNLSDCIKDGGSIAFEMAYGCKIWDFESKNPEFSYLFCDAMACTNKLMMKAIVDAYKDGFELVGSLVDIGGGMGGAAAEIVRSYPHIKGINFDQPHIIATAPALSGVCHVGGDMFEAILSANTVFMKFILHDWNDEDCVRILKNCRKAVSKKMAT